MIINFFKFFIKMSKIVWNVFTMIDINILDNRGSKRKHWMKEEDNAIVELVREYGTKDWTLISKMIKQKYGINKRSAKQCRERWHNHLDPNIKKDPLCIEEEKRLFELHKIYGNKWAQIANEMEGRTDNTIKNHFYSTLRRQLRKINNLLLSTKFELLYGRKMKEVTLDDLYKYLKDWDGGMVKKDYYTFEPINSVCIPIP